MLVFGFAPAPAQSPPLEGLGAMDSGEKAALGGHQSRQEQVLTKHLRGKAIEWASMADRGQPLQLLDLPVDILQAVIKEVTNTNDLTSLALTHSALHALVIPHIYSRFDIVWPDNNSAVETRVGVDALTYGLNTLVMDHDVFGEAPTPRTSSHPAQKCGHCGKFNQCLHGAQPVRRRRIRRGNNFAQYTRKFSLGNGPMEWVQEYAITKEAGKMLGTLIALAVGRMRNLEAFIFDMPTGVLRDVWLALASLADRDDGQECRLEQVWVRWHDNSDQAPLGPASLPGAAPTLIQPSHTSGTYSTQISHPPLFSIPPYPRVEFPTFSILPPLKSLSVLDIDELPYAEEMSVLIEISVDKLRELRVGVAQHAQFDPWVRPAEDTSYVPSLTSTSTNQMSRVGGILGILVARMCHVSSLSQNELDGNTHLNPNAVEFENKTSVNSVASIYNKLAALDHMQSAVMVEQGEDATEGDRAEADQVSEIELMTETFANQFLEHVAGLHVPIVSNSIPVTKSASNSKTKDQEGSDQVIEPKQRLQPNQKLKLEVLELERVPLSVTVLSKAIDWSRLTTLTLLGCRNHEQLWRALRKRFAPLHSRNSSLSLQPSARFTSSFLTPTPTSKSTPLPSAYTLQIRQLHTDTVSHALLTFIHTTLAPNTLTRLFLQASPTFKSPVSASQIYKFAIRRHRASLRKLLIDSSLRPLDPDNPSGDTTHLHWLYPRDLLAAITSPKMHLRELSLSLSHHDWHFFLQRLPHAYGLRSLHIARIAHSPRGGHNMHNARPRRSSIDPKETALQVLDIVALRPELELCYLAVKDKCFEVLECDGAASRKGKSVVSGPLMPGSIVSEGDGEGDGDVDVESDDGHHHHVAHGANNNATTLAQATVTHSDFAEESDMDFGSTAGTETTTDDDEGSQPDGESKKRTVKTFKLREILFYDDKVSIFKARHGKL
jgi:hypothetical protein